MPLAASIETVKAVLNLALFSGDIKDRFNFSTCLLSKVKHIKPRAYLVIKLIF